MPIEWAHDRRVGAKRGPRRGLIKLDRDALRDARDQRGHAWLVQRLKVDRRTIDRMISGATKAPNEETIGLLRRILGIVDIRDPLSDDEIELLTLYRRSALRLPAEAERILVETRKIAAKIESLHRKQEELDAERAALRDPDPSPREVRERNEPSARNGK